MFGELLSAVRELNDNPDIDGFMPTPPPIALTTRSLGNGIPTNVDGFGNAEMSLDLPCCCHPQGHRLLARRGWHRAGKHAVILGRSSIVGTPMALLLRRNGAPGNCTVTICHSRTQNLAEHTRRADILVAAIGRAHFVTEDMVKDGAVVIDVGINRIPDASKKSGSRLTGDVDFDNVAPKCSWITPVPGGVGPMTIASLMQNTLQACSNKDA